MYSIALREKKYHVPQGSVPGFHCSYVKITPNKHSSDIDLSANDITFC